MNDQQTATGEKLRDLGVARSLAAADEKTDKWSDNALQFIVEFPGNEFMAEDVRAWAYENGLQQPPNERAWGGVIVKARKNGLIEANGFRSVTNVKAHRTPATVWKRLT